MSNVQSINSWFNILGWTSSPLFGACHHLKSYEEFEQQYYCSSAIEHLEKNVVQALQDGNTSCVKFSGSPGCGKTSFLYHLWKKSCYDPLSPISKYFFYVFHANRADDPDEYRKLVRYELLQAWEKYYAACGFSDTFRRIDEQGISRKEKLSLLSDYFKNHREGFKKSLIVVIDDIDLLEDAMAFKISSAVKRDLELASVILWVSIRPNTFRHYCVETKKFFNEFFPVVYSYPSVSLYEVIAHRISTISGGDFKNPFSKALCDEILFLLFEGDKRSSLNSLKAILENTPPKRIRSTESEDFIQNYIEQSAISTFIGNDTLPNLHEEFFRSVRNYPLPYDVVQLCRYSKDKNIIYGALNQIAIQRSRRSSALSDVQRKIQIREPDLDYVITKLCDANVLVKEGRKHISLTGPGQILAKYSSRAYYNNKCKELLPPVEVDETYWEYHRTQLNYEKVVDTYLTWKDQYNT